MNPYKKDILKLLESSDQTNKLEVIDFPSGALMIDFWVDVDFFTIQISGQSFGISQIDENSGFCSIPDISFDNFTVFKDFLVTSLKT